MFYSLTLIDKHCNLVVKISLFKDEFNFRKFSLGIPQTGTDL